MPDPHRREVEDFTKPFLAMMFLVLFTGLFMVWAAYGYAASLVSGLFLHLLIDRIPRRN